ncbi:single-stranded-DNA-specific exonuclease RecJ [Flammeovirgaceae bacterium 311]|nr:single-stranded-DNA-specific exonuclease RecJ [Flammeovirgaceae bacterium 311]
MSEKINVDPVIANLLVQRGITSYNEAFKYFRPQLEDLHDPWQMKDMELAVERLELAIDRGERILIYGDYDVDGTTSVALAYGFLREHYSNLDFYIPDRYKEGYGISDDGITYAIEEDFGLVISLDCGIKAINTIKRAAEAGVDFIVCDHHLPGDILPPAVAVLDPKRSDCPYPYKELSGCGIGFKFLQAFCLKNEIPLEHLYEYLDLVAVSIAADIVPITGENRILAYWGLKKLNMQPRPGLSALIEQAGFKKAIDITNVVFGIGPRINASGRVDHAKAAVNLLLTQELEEAAFLAEGINDKNSLRRNFDSTITEEAHEMVKQDPDFKNAKTTVLFKNDWHKGVIGIVASRCVDCYYRPTIILTESNNKATGSARSVVGFDIYEAIMECSDLLLQYGGHMYAAGLTMELENVPLFRQRFEEVVARRIRPEQLIPQLEIDIPLGFDQITPKFYSVLKQMSPFGPENLQPVFMTRQVKAAGRTRIMKNRHLKVSVVEEETGITFEAVGFDMADYFDFIDSGMRFDIAYTLEENTFWGEGTLELYLRDIKFEE